MRQDWSKKKATKELGIGLPLLNKIECQLVSEALKKYNWNMGKTAEALRTSMSRLEKTIGRCGLKPG